VFSLTLSLSLFLALARSPFKRLSKMWTTRNIKIFYETALEGKRRNRNRCRPKLPRSAVVGPTTLTFASGVACTGNPLSSPSSSTTALNALILSKMCTMGIHSNTFFVQSILLEVGAIVVGIAKCCPNNASLSGRIPHDSTNPECGQTRAYIRPGITTKFY